MDRNKEEAYSLSPKSLLGDSVCLTIIEYMGKLKCNAIVFDDGTLRFAHVEQMPEETKP